MLALLFGALLLHLAGIAAFGVWAIRYPFELDYGEGIVWQQMRLMFDGRAYGPIDGFPAIVFHYPPVYHALTWSVAQMSGADGLAAGRAISLASLAGAMSLGAAMVHRIIRSDGDRTVAAASGAVAALLMISNWPVLFWTPVMRVDLLGLALSFAGVWLCMLSLERPRLIHAAALAFVLAVYTKHSMIAAPAGCFGALLLLRPRVALHGILTAILLGTAALLALVWMTDGGFARHLFLYNINRFELRQLQTLQTLFSAHALYFVTAAFGVRQVLRRAAASAEDAQGLAGFRARLERAGPGALLLGYLLSATLMLPLVAKSGSNVNYLIEFTCVAMLFAALALKDAVAAFLHAPTASFRNAGLATLLAAAMAAQALILPTDRFQKLSPKPPETELARLSALVRSAEKPVISDDMVLLIRSGKDVVWEAAIFAELASTGLYDERQFVTRIDRREFEFFITFRERGEATFDSRYNPAVADAIERAYPERRYLAGFTVHFPAR